MNKIRWADDQMQNDINYYADTFSEYFDHHDASNDVIISTLSNMLSCYLHQIHDEDVLDQSLISIKFMYYEYEKRVKIKGVTRVTPNEK